MSAAPSDAVNVTIDGQPVVGRKGQMIMQTADAHGSYIPRFCYHDKLSVAANCRMCLVEVEKAPKPQPACATPIAEGMKIFTKSPRAIAAQKATMEFLLINHPLDCPICDQGGECELQDLAVGFGRDISRYAERKRSVKDKDLGPLVSTDMTRCIHCTRCVRFGQEIQGFPQLGTAGRGEHMEITTYVEQSVDHELSANIIDLCPVGALNSKPFRYRGRAWEMTQHALVSPHDAFGTNLYGHSLRGRLMRMVPRQNDAINETWITDRDRFGFEGMYAADRALAPMVRTQGELREVDWETALAAAAEALGADCSAPANMGFLATPSSTLEELYLFAQIARHVGTGNIDHRLRQSDFRISSLDLPYPSLGLSIAELDSLQSILVVGADLRAEMPMLAHRLRKAVVKNGAKIAFINPRRFEYFFPVEHYLQTDDLLRELAEIRRLSAESASQPPGTATSSEQHSAHQGLASLLSSGERRAIFIGQLAQRHAQYGAIKEMVGELAAMTGARVGVLTEGANSAGAFLAGALPSTSPNGASTGLDAAAMLRACSTFVLLGAIDPADDLQSDEQLQRADCVIALTPFLPDALRASAHIVLPTASFAETAGTFVNCEGRWQSWSGAAKSPGEARPAWKVMRVLGNLLGSPDFEFATSEEVRDRLQSEVQRGAAPVPHSHDPMKAGSANGHVHGSWAELGIYASDALVRRSPPLTRADAVDSGAEI